MDVEDRYFTDIIGSDCYWWIPGYPNKDMDLSKTDLLSMVDFVFWNLGLDRLFQKVIPSFDAFTDQVFTKEQWMEIRRIAAENGGEWNKALMETDDWAERTFKQFDVFTLVTV